MALIESLAPDDGTPQVGSAEYGAWNLRKLLPSEAVHRPAVRWPGGAAELLEVPDGTLKKLRESGDHPRLYAIGRALFTTREDLRDWIMQHEVAPGFTVRPPTRRRIASK